MYTSSINFVRNYALLASCKQQCTQADAWISYHIHKPFIIEMQHTQKKNRNRDLNMLYADQSCVKVFLNFLSLCVYTCVLSLRKAVIGPNMLSKANNGPPMFILKRTFYSSHDSMFFFWPHRLISMSKEHAFHIWEYLRES